MNARRSDALVLAPLLVVASLAAHGAAYVLATPAPRDREALLAETGHGYLGWAPAVVGVAGFLVVVALALRALAAARGLSGRSASPLLVLVPVAAFVVQETLERLLSGGLSPALLAERTLQFGIVLQLAFGLVSFAVARLLARGAEELGRLARRRPAVHPRAVVLPRLAAIDLPPRRPLPLHVAGRGPPSSAA